MKRARRTPGAAALPHDVARLAEQTGLGAARGARALGGGSTGCLGLGLVVVLLPPGIGLVAGPYGPAVTALGVLCLAVALALVPVTVALSQRRTHRVPYLYLFDGGIVLATAGGIAPCRWTDIRLVEYTQSATTGQGAGIVTVNRLRLEHVEGGALCSLGAAAPLDRIARLALAGGALT